MRIYQRLTLGAATAFAIAATAAASIGPAVTTWAADHGDNDTPARSDDQYGEQSDTVRLALTPSSPQLAQCMPDARVTVAVKLTTDKQGADKFAIDARHIAPNRDYTVFLLEQAGAPFGAAEYIGDLSTNAEGNGNAEFHLIVQEAFSSTIVNGQRVRVDLNRVGMWFADPKGDDFCLGPNSPVTPFDGDNEAGVQAFNSANADPLPAP
jgi:hypothetical protein